MKSALQALADPTRREIFERINDRPSAVGQLADQLPISRPAVSQHLAVLKHAGLVCDVAKGTQRIYSVNREGLVPLRVWLGQFWGEALAGFADQVEIENQKKNKEADK
ncbi:MAG TPA: ArsR family transcriptional regulator [Devosia sp.]|nr:ArsR family transcriptional regulator [Devosia sp.]